MFEKVQEWKEAKEPQAWAKIPEYIKQYLIQNRGHECEVCDTKFWIGNKVPLDVIYKDGDSYNNKEENLQLICPNCRAQSKIH